MPKFTIAGQEPEEKPLELELVEGYGDFVTLVVRGHGGGRLINFCPDGSVHRVPGVNTGLGLKLDGAGRLVIQ